MMCRPACEEIASDEGATDHAVRVRQILRICRRGGGRRCRRRGSIYLTDFGGRGCGSGESLERWRDTDAKLQVIFIQDDLTLRIPAALEKGNKDRILPIAPQFAEFLLRTPWNLPRSRFQDASSKGAWRSAYRRPGDEV